MKEKLTYMVLAVVLAGCDGSDKSPTTQSMDNSQTRTVDVLNEYSAKLVSEHPDDFSGFESAEQTMESPLSFVTRFTAKGVAMLSRPRAPSDVTALKHNEELTSHWTRSYCTTELKSTMKSQGVFMSTGIVVDASGNKHTIAGCLLEAGGEIPPDTGRPIQDVGGFTTAQICKAGFSVWLGRDMATMHTNELGDHVQIQYARPSDGKEFSYRCRLENNYILSWDDKINGVRWYGSEPGDWKVWYNVENGKLLIKSIAGDRLSEQKWFSIADIK